MQATSDSRPLPLGIRTELAINAGRTSISYGPRYAVLRTSQNPTYYMGNLLIYDRAPRSGDMPVWLRDFEDAFGGDPQVRHAAFAFGASEGTGASEEFVANGFTLEDHAVMRARAVAAFDAPPGLTIRRFADDGDWGEQLEMQMAAMPAIHDASEYRVFKERQIAHHRDIAARIGAWFGAFDGGRLAGSCGVFKAGAGLARFQDVTVHPSYRNRGVARALICAAGAAALHDWTVTELIIVAKRDDFPRRIYQKCGFEDYQREAALWKAQRALA